MFLKKEMFTKTFVGSRTDFPMCWTDRTNLASIPVEDSVRSVRSCVDLMKASLTGSGQGKNETNVIIIFKRDKNIDGAGKV